MRARYKDLEPGDFGEQLAPYSHVELKVDGWFAEFVGGSHGWAIHSRGGEVLRYGYDPIVECYVRGEMVVGTEWARASRSFGKFIPWEAVYLEDDAPKDYQHGRRLIREFLLLFPGVDPMVKANYTDDIDRAEYLWREFVLGQGWEGLIFRSEDGRQFGRMKRVQTQDYVCTGVERRGSVIVALYGGLHIDGVLETVCSVPLKSARSRGQAMMRDHYDHLLGSVFEAKGNALLKSGALRHARHAGEGGAVKWRPDKRVEECRL